MAKKNRTRSAAVPTPAEVATRGESDKPGKHPSARFGRETVDALAIAIVLALLIRTFQIEPFVIPTGSMAPTLMGKHKDVTCDQCGTRFRVNASDEDGEQLQLAVQMRRLTRREAARRLPGYQTAAGVCPQCRYVQPLRTDGLERALPEGGEPVSTKTTFAGDRLIVNKYHYSFADPLRWEVAVFKYPGKAQQNYIKRIVGLPGESLRLVGGDLFVGDGGDYEIARKPPGTILSMAQHVHDTDHDPSRLYAAGWPLRWRPAGDGWRVDADDSGKLVRQRYTVDAGGETRWLHYRHTPPTEPVWERVLAGDDVSSFEPAPELVTDFIPYNSRILRQQVVATRQFTARSGAEQDLSRAGLHWVGDLMLEAEVDVRSAEGELLLELVEAGDGFGCAIDLVSGEATFYRRAFESTEREAIATASTPVRGAGARDVRLSNFDDQLVLWVDGAVVAQAEYDAGATPAERLALAPRTSESDPGDLAPARVGATGGEVIIDRLQVSRDIYYIADTWRRTGRSFVTDYDMDEARRRGRGVWKSWLLDLPKSPGTWDFLATRRHADFQLSDDQYFVMGDNSPESLDARLWYGGGGRDPGRPGGSYLERDLLVGKAICVFWPHAWYSIPLGPVGLPLVPNLPDMRLIR